MTGRPTTRRMWPLAGATDRRMVVVFLVATFALTWLMFLPVIVGLADPESPAGLIFLPLIGIGAPSIMAFVLTGLSQGRTGVRALRRRGTRWRVGISWYAIVVLLPCLAYAVSWVASAGLAAPSLGPWVPALISGLLAGILEEFGWSGFAFPRLQALYGFVPAGLAMGFIVAFWHLPLFFTPGQPQHEFAFMPFLLTLIVVRFLFGWVYNGSGGGILLLILLHASGNFWSELLPLGPPAVDAAWVGEISVYGAAAAIVFFLYRGPVHNKQPEEIWTRTGSSRPG
jgi:membrane protease YdiL (CAAX protease family)